MTLPLDQATTYLHTQPNQLAVRAPLDLIVSRLSREQMKLLALQYGVEVNNSNRKKEILRGLIDRAIEARGIQVWSIFQRAVPPKRKGVDKKAKAAHLAAELDDARNTESADGAFPPKPPSDSLQRQVIRNFCNDLDPSNFEEAGCAVCGMLVPLKDMRPLTEGQLDYSLLCTPDVTRRERKSAHDAIEELPGPVMLPGRDTVCVPCQRSVAGDKVPKHSLANGLWLGEVPEVLKGLTFAEKMLVARVRHNRCLVRVASGRAKMMANAIMFANPTVKVYQSLPPPREDLEEVLACIFMGSAKPTNDDFKRTPMLVRRNQVKKALEWLKLNHRDYEDLTISTKDLESYPLSGVPVQVDFRKSEDGADPTDKDPLEMSKHETSIEQGTAEGPCPFVVRGLTGAEYMNINMKTLKLKAMKHLESDGLMLGIGHEDTPQSMYHNPQAYPQMFPWLFPYGLGGIGQTRHAKVMSEREHKRRLLLYHDKRFQTDLYFPMIAFNHEQMKSNVTGSFLFAKRKDFTKVSTRLANLKPDVLQAVSQKLSKGETFKPETEDEKTCRALLDDIDHVGAFADGFLTSKKRMKNEIWALIAAKGAPNWFITFSPTDSRHPLCLYYADQDIKFSPSLRPDKERDQLILTNPVAAARFFHTLVTLVIKHVLGVDSEISGLYGDPAAYYGTVEQQGRLTLHLHLMLWIKDSMSPQRIRDKLMDKDSDFQKALIAYLEGTHKGEFLTGAMDDVKSCVNAKVKSNRNGDPNGYLDPTMTLPVGPPPQTCGHDEELDAECPECKSVMRWNTEFREETDDILVRSNVHSCRVQRKMGDNDYNLKDQSRGSDLTMQSAAKGCLDKDEICSARFPRDTQDETTVDEEDGHITMKKLEAWVNTFTPSLSYLLRCNSDVTCLMSGTSIKAIVAYVTDYITKVSLKSHQIFSAAYDMYDRNSEIFNGDTRDGARRMVLKICNSLTAKMELGSPMASMYLLGNPDHYTSHNFVPFFWKRYVARVKASWPEPNTQATPHSDDVGDPDSIAEEPILLSVRDGELTGRSCVDDYVFRPDIYQEVSLYDWIQYSVKRRIPRKKKSNFEYSSGGDDSDDEGFHAEEGDSDVYSRFKGDHPQSKTHEVKCVLKDNTGRIPNFLGGVLPRRSEGDYEYYCMTMLTLFSSWRSGLDLKIDGQLWSESFDAKTFSPYFVRVMKNINLRYECLDAKDDYRAQINKLRAHKKKAAMWSPSTGQYDYADEYDEDFIEELGLHVDDHGLLDEQYDVGSSRLRRMTQMQEAQNIISRTGWLDDLPTEESTPHPTVTSGTSSTPVGIADEGDPVVLSQSSSKVRQDTIDEPEVEGRAPVGETAHNNSSVSHFIQTGLSPNHWKGVVKAKKQEVLASKQKNTQALPVKPAKGKTCNEEVKAEVKLLDATYLKYFFRAKEKKSMEIIDNIVSGFSLNREQERAFRIVANHAASNEPDQLKMYLGGMGGTGKSQVIKALIAMFEKRNESHRFIVLAPTGTAAALLNGSTYHSMLGIMIRGKDEDNSPRRNETVSVNEARSRLRGVDYIFIDEISMVSCHELYGISAKLASIANNYDSPFGGYNMILAGDFAQLPPTSGVPLYGMTDRYDGNTSMRLRSQESAIGKHLWHQCTTVVILTQNMRQKTQGEDDAEFRDTLVNMRYGACTPSNLKFLRSRVANRASHRTTLAQPKFRNVSVITAWNTYKDRYNILGAAKFAKEIGKELHEFVSKDVLGVMEDVTTKKGGRVKRRKYGQTSLSQAVQHLIWNMEPHTSEHIPGKLNLCEGMPVMIRHNDATELCITKGQEGKVVGWDCHDGEWGTKALDTVYVELINPPTNVQFPNLPENVVPIVKSKQKIRCSLPDDSILNVEREQVNLLCNFSMTDYASQGKTREYNVVDLSRCKNYQSIYTCLSRSSKAANTVILQHFDTDKITKGINGRLRQEFRELQILDTITRMRFEDTLAAEVRSKLRLPLIRLFNRHQGGVAEQSKAWHSALQYKASEEITERQTAQSHVMLWQDEQLFQHDAPGAKKLSPKPNKTVSSVTHTTNEDAIPSVPMSTSMGVSYTSPSTPPRLKETCPPQSPTRPKRTQLSGSSLSPSQRSKRACLGDPIQFNRGPAGVVWDGNNYSCPYDAVIVILYDIWNSNPLIWQATFNGMSPYLATLTHSFPRIQRGETSVEEARDIMRRQLSNTFPQSFPQGKKFAAVYPLLAVLLGSEVRGHAHVFCTVSGCNYSTYDARLQMPAVDETQFRLAEANHTHGRSIRLSNLLDIEAKRMPYPCQVCAHPTSVLRRVVMNDRPNIVAFDCQSRDVFPDPSIFFPTAQGRVMYRLSGIIYYGQNHFTARIIDRTGQVWYHDGITTGSRCRLEGHLNGANTEWLSDAYGRSQSFFLYAKVV